MSTSTMWKECGQAECSNLKFKLLRGFGASHEAITKWDIQLAIDMELNANF